MNHHPDGRQIVHEIEVALARCTDRDVSRLSQSIRVIDFLDTQRHKIERGEWSTQSYFADRVALSWSKAWREAPKSARTQVSACLGSMGTRIQHAEQMKSLWGQVADLRAELGIGLPRLPDVPGMVRGAVDFASRLAGRRTSDIPEAPESPAPKRSMR